MTYEPTMFTKSPTVPQEPPTLLWPLYDSYLNTPFAYYDCGYVGRKGERGAGEGVGGKRWVSQLIREDQKAQVQYNCYFSFKIVRCPLAIY